MKAYTDIFQSEKLAEILPIESADMYFSKYDTIHAATLYSSCDSEYFKIHEYIPCWSLAALFDALPEGVIENYNAPNLQKENGKYSIAYGNEELLCVADNPLDACYEMILKLHDEKLL